MLSHSSASSTWRSWLNFCEFFFSLKKLSQLDAIELARCPWARAMCLSELDGAEPARCSWASSQKLPNVLNCQVQSPLITLVLDMVPLKKPKVTVKTYPWWNWASYMFWARSKKWKIGNSNIILLHTHPFAHKHFYTQTLLHTDRNFYTQTLLHTDTLTQKPFDTQKLRHTDPIYTQTLLHTNAYTLTLTPFYIQHQLNRNFTSVFAHRASFRAKGLLRHK